MADLRLQFQIDSKGGEELSRQLARIADDLNKMPTAAKRGIEELSTNISGIVKSLQTLGSATSGIGKVGKSIEDAFGSAKVNLVKSLRQEIQGLENQYKTLTQKTEEYNQAARKARAAGDEAAAQRAEGMAASTGIEATTALRQQQMAQEALAKYTGANGGGGVMGMLGNMGGMAAGPAMAFLRGFVGPVAAAAGAAAAGQMVFRNLTQSAFYESAGSATKYDYEQAGVSDLASGDLTRLIYRSNLGGGRRNEGLLSFGLRAMKNYVGNALSTGDMFDEAGRVRYITEMEGEEMDLRGFAGARSTQARMIDMGRRFNTLNRQVGTRGMADIITALSGQFNPSGVRISQEEAAPILQQLAAYGTGGYEGGTRSIATVARRLNIPMEMVGEIARRGEVGRDLRSVEAMFSQAGATTQAAQGALASYSAGMAGTYDPLGAVGVAGFGRGAAGASAAIQAAMPGVSPLASVQVGMQVDQSLQRGLNTSMDPTRIVTMKALMEAGLNASQASLIINEDLTNPETRRKANELLKRVGGRGDVGKIVASSLEDVESGMQGMVDTTLGKDALDLFGPNAGLGLMTGQRSATAGAMRAGRRGALTGANARATNLGTGDTVEAAASTAAAISEEGINENVRRNADTLVQAMRKMIVQFEESTAQIQRLTDMMGGNRSPVMGPKPR